MKRTLLTITMLAGVLMLTGCYAPLFYGGGEVEEYTHHDIGDEPTPEATQQGVEMTLSFDFGERTGIYAGETKDGLPHGQGSFSSSNAEGLRWVYEGSWVEGHMEGQGTTTFETGYKETGWYERDSLNGEGATYWDDKLQYEGEFAANAPDGQGKLYSLCGELIFAGHFSEGYIDETQDARRERLSDFRERCVQAAYSDMEQSAAEGGDVRTVISGRVLYVFESDFPYQSSFLVECEGGDICVSYHLSVGEDTVAAGESITVWGIADDEFTYETDAGTEESMPMIEAWDVRNVSGTAL